MRSYIEINMAILSLLFSINIITAMPFEGAKCGYESCNKVDPHKINIHLIPHSHDDVGWLKTVDQYYYGGRNNIQMAGVEHIIGSVVQALQKDASRRFIQVETAFFWQWWQKQPEEIREITRQLVNSGRLEIINGAWSMNDEAAAHYHSIIDQFTWGLKRINDTLGKCGRPKIGWQIDPFGHSKEMASLFAQIGYEGVFFARLDYRDEAKRQKTRNMEMIWQGSHDLGNSSDIFTGVLYDFYTAPAYFCWDVLCGDTPIVNDKKSIEYNADKFVERFTDYVIKGLAYYKTNNLLVTMGGDFTYQAAEMYYTNMDRLISSFNELSSFINVIYSTPSCYLKAVNEAAKDRHIKFELKTDDFFPYASGNHSYWTGYFTSRPNSKRSERQGNNLLQVMKQVASFAKYKYNKNFEEDLIPLKEAMGIMQHHDAITGTEKQHVAHDYARILTAAMNVADNNIDEIIVDMVKKVDNVDDVKIKFTSCLLMNISHCQQSNLDRFAVVVFNPLSRYVTHYVRLPVNGNSYAITGPNGNVNYEIVPTIADFSYVDSIKPSKYELVFAAENLPPLGLHYFYIEKQERIVKKVLKASYKRTRFGNVNCGFTINEETGLLSSVTLKGITVEVNQTFMFYNGANGTNKGEINRASGAYIFRPANTTPVALPISDRVTYKSYSSELMDEVHQVFNSWIRQIIRVYKHENFIEFDWLVGPIQIINDLGVEVITRFSTEMKSNGIFYTDSNGRQMVKRVLNFRETYGYTNEEPISGNYYPITSSILIRDKNPENHNEVEDLEFSILNDRAQGGSSLDEGQIEVMIHRRLLNDDAFGVGEALNEQEFGRGVVVRGQHYLTFAESSNAAAYRRHLAQTKLLSPWIFIGDATSSEHSLDNLKAKLNFEFSGLTNPLPPNVQILTLEPWTENTLLLRLEHIFMKNEDEVLSQPVTVNLNNLFTLLNILSVEEMNLAANVPKSEIQKMSWDISKIKKTDNHSKIVNLNIVLKPMEIRTFIVHVSAKSF